MIQTGVLLEKNEENLFFTPGRILMHIDHVHASKTINCILPRFEHPNVLYKDAHCIIKMKLSRIMDPEVPHRGTMSFDI